MSLFHPIFAGGAAEKEAGDGTCVRFKLGDKDGRTHVDGTRFDPGDWGIAVRWLSRLEEDAEQRTFELEGDDSGRVDDSRLVVINSTELRFHSIEMEVLEAEGPAVRRSTRTAARSATSRAHLTRKYRLPIDAEDAILKACF